ncbi:MAG: 3'-5' exonuclease [Spartobacteria bacterium]|nr:3'-5' exonuclease [Spartobacteria bacterium]
MKKIDKNRATVRLLSVLAVCGLVCVSAVGAAASVKCQPTKGVPYGHRKIANTTFVAFDTETTGFSAKKDRIVEIAGVKYRNGEIIERRTWLINPQRKMPYWAERVHGISDAMLADQPTFAEIYPEFLEFIDGSVLMAHNATFDVGFLQEEIKRIGADLPPNKTIDSLPLFRAWYPEVKRHNLEAMAEHLHVNNGGFHRALADSVYIALILDEGLKRFDDSARLRDIYSDAGGPLSF